MKFRVTMPVPHEVELKLMLPPNWRATLESSRSLSGEKPQRRHLITTYYDTPERLLYSAGLTLRARHDGSNYIQNVKTQSSGRGLALTRAEWEWPIDQREPVVELLYEIPQLSKIAHRMRGNLKPQFVTDVWRKTWLIELPHKTIVEVAIDDGQIKAGHIFAPIAELELELKSGRIDHLYDLAARLHASTPLRISYVSKAARGWQLRYGQAEGPKLLRRIAIQSDARCMDVFQEIIETQLNHLVANIDPALRGDGEGIHQMHMAVRGLRAALCLFEPLFKHLGLTRFDSELQRLGRVLGVARDWDVFCAETLPVAEKKWPSQRLDRLGSAANAQQGKAHKAMTVALLAKPFTAFVLKIAIWVAAQQWEARTFRGSHMGDAIATVAPALLDRAAHRAHKRGKNIKKLSKDELHSLRKALDMLCDDVAYLGNIYSQRAVKAYRRRCEILQALLGAANDCVETERLTRKLIRRGPKALRNPGTALLIGAEHRRHIALLDLGTVVKKFREADRFWRE